MGSLKMADAVHGVHRGLPLLVVGGETPARAKNGQWQPETGMGFQAASKSMISMPS